MISGLSSLSAHARLTGPNWALRPARGSLASRWASPRAALELAAARGSLVPTGPSWEGNNAGNKDIKKMKQWREVEPGGRES